MEMKAVGRRLQLEERGRARGDGGGRPETAQQLIRRPNE